MTVIFATNMVIKFMLAWNSLMAQKSRISEFSVYVKFLLNELVPF